MFNNAPSQEAIRPWVPAGPGHVVVTSRDFRWSEIAVRVEMDVFARSESVALLRAQVPTLTKLDADALGTALGDLPLAVAQAARGMSTREYLQLLGRSATELVNGAPPGSYPVPLAGTVRVSLERLVNEDQAAGQLLMVCAFLGPDPIPTRMLTTASPGALPDPLAAVATSSLAFRRCVGWLGCYGLAKVTEDWLQLHRLTQDTLPPEQRNDQAVLAGADPDDVHDPVFWPDWAELLRHLRMADLANPDNCTCDSAPAPPCPTSCRTVKPAPDSNSPISYTKPGAPASAWTTTALSPLPPTCMGLYALCEY